MQVRGDMLVQSVTRKRGDEFAIAREGSHLVCTLRSIKTPFFKLRSNETSSGYFTILKTQKEEMGLHLNLIKIIRILIRLTKCIFQLQPHSRSTNWKSLDDHCPMQLFGDLLRQLSHCCLVKSSSFLLLSSSHPFTHRRSKLNC